MKSHSLPITALRASRLLAALACIAGVAIIACWAQSPAWMAANASALPPPLVGATIYVLGVAVLLAGFAPFAVRLGAQILGALGAAVAAQAVVQTWTGLSFGTDLLLFPETLARLHPTAP